MSVISNTCGLTRNRTKATSCQYTLNKVVKIYLANVADIDAIATTSESGCGEEVSAITLASSAKWAMVDPSTDSASFTDALNVADNDVRYRTHSLSFSISGDYDGAAVCDLNGLSLGEFVAVAVLASGNAVMLGTENVGLRATTATLQGSATSTDFSGIQVEMSADTTVAALPVSKAALDAIKGNIYA